MATLSDFFCGKVSERKSSVCHAIEWGRAYIGTSTEKIYRFEGVPLSLVPSGGSQTVTDASGNSFTVSFDNSMTMSSTNPPHVETQNDVTVTKRSIHLYDIEVRNLNVTDGI